MPPYTSERSDASGLLGLHVCQWNGVQKFTRCQIVTICLGGGLFVGYIAIAICFVMRKVMSSHHEVLLAGQGDRCQSIPLEIEANIIPRCVSYIDAFCFAIHL